MPRRLRFLHPLTRSAAYSALLKDNRELLHSATADSLLQRRQAGMAGEAELLGELLIHLTGAGRFTEAHQLCCEAVYLAARSSNLERGAALARRSAELWALARETDPVLPAESLRLLWVQGELLLAQGDLGKAEAVLEQLRSLARDQQDRELLCRALTSLGSLHHSRGELATAEDDLRSAEALAYMLDDPTLQRFAASVFGSVRLRQGDRHGAHELMSRALEIAREQGNTARIAAELSNLASVETAMGELEQAEAHYRESLGLARWLGNNYLTSLAAGNLGDLLHERGRDAEARELLGEALGIARPIGSRLLCGYWLNSLGFIELDSDRPAAALTYLFEALEIFEALEDRVQQSSVHAGLALLLEQAAALNPADLTARARSMQHAAAAERLAAETGIGPGSFTRLTLGRLAALQAANAGNAP